jgi:hypothetical protein
MKTVFAAFFFLLPGLQVIGQDKSSNISPITPALQADGTHKITFVETRLLDKEAKGAYLFSATEGTNYYTNPVRDFNSNNMLYQTRRGNDVFIRGGSTTYLIDGMQVQRR